MDWAGYRTVLGVPLGDLTVGVVRTPDGRLLFPGPIDVRGGVVLEGFRPEGKKVDGRTVVAGRRLPSVARVVVIDDRGEEYEARLGDEVWVAVAGEAAFSEPLVRFEDAEGALLSLPLPDGPRTPVTDADAPCPVCGAVAWVEIDAGAYCERCGLQVGAGLVFMYAAAIRGDADGGDDDTEDLEERYERERAEALASVAFPIYGVVGRERLIGGYSSTDDGVQEVTVEQRDADGALFVHTRDAECGSDGRLRTWLANLLRRREAGGARSQAAERVHHADAQRRARWRAARAEQTTREIVVDGRPEPFAFIAVDDVWVAERDHLGVIIRIVARGVDPGRVALEPLSGVGTGARAAQAARRAAAGELLSRDEVAALIDEHRLGEHRNKLLAAIRPGYRLCRDSGSPHRIGGLPDLAPGEAWPHDEHRIPYTFIAQIDCSQLPPLVSEFEAPAWNHRGALLRIFAALDGRVPEGGPAVALTCSPGAPLTRTAVPPRPDPMPADAFEPEDDSLHQLVEQPVSPTPFLTAHVGWYVLGDSHYELGYDEFAQRLSAGGAKPRARAWADAQLLGHASNEQGDDPALSGAWLYPDTGDDDWCTLLNIPEHPGMSFGDGGSLAIVIRLDDLAAGRYDRMATDQSMG